MTDNSCDSFQKRLHCSHCFKKDGRKEGSIERKKERKIEKKKKKKERKKERKKEIITAVSDIAQPLPEMFKNLFCYSD